MKTQYADIDCSNLEGKEKFLCLMIKEIFWFDKPEISFGVYKVFRKKQKLIENVLNEIVENLENSLNEENKFDNLKDSILKNLENKLDTLKKRKIKNCNNKEDLKQILKEIKDNYQMELGKIEDEEAKVEIEDIIDSINKFFYDVENTGVLAPEVYNHLYGFFSLYYNKGDFGYTKNRYNVYQVSYQEKDIIKKENIEHIACEDSTTEEYDGSEILFRWQNWDTYYIKTLKYAKDYGIKNLEIFEKNINIKLTIDIENSEEDLGNKEQKLKLNEMFYDESNKLLTLKFIISKEESKLEEIIGKILESLDIRDKEIKLKNSITDKEATKKLEDIIKKGSNEVLKSRKSFLDKIEFPDKSKIIVLEEIDKIFEENKDLSAIWKLLRGIALFKEGTNSDYFIHKNLKRFLTKELDKYIKNRIFSDTDDLLNNPETLNKSIKIAKLFKQSAEKIIDILSQIEDFQKKLWELRKLVKKAEYVISSKEIQDEKILKFASENEKQREDWKNLGIPLPNSIDDLKDKSYPIDTKHFNFEEKYKILSSIDNIEEKLNGVLIKSENFQALKFLEPKHTQKITTIYIDPPYNTGSDDFLYKDSYQHSSWLTMMENRLRLARELMKDDGVIFVSIDDNEVKNLEYLMNLLFFEIEKLKIKMRNPERQLTQKSLFQKSIEYCLLFSKQQKPYIKEKTTPYDFSEYKYKIIEKNKPYRTFQIGKYKIEEFLPHDYEIKEVKDTNDPFIVKAISIRGKIKTAQFTGKFYEENLRPIFEKEKNYDVLYKVYGIGDDGFGFRYIKNPSKATINAVYYQGIPLDIRKNINEATKKISYFDFYDFEKDMNNESKFIRNMGLLSITSIKPVNLITFLIEMNRNDSIILDFFAGSGTTGHAVALLNTKNAKKIIEQILELRKKLTTLKSGKTIEEKEEEEIKELEKQFKNIEFENRKYILVEINDYFDTVIIPRMKKLMYSLVWKDGKPQYPFGYSHIFKYLYLEQYETLLEIYGNLDISQDDKDTEYIFNKDFNELTNIRIKPLIREPIGNKNYDLLEAYIFHNNLDLVKVKYEDEILIADVKDKYDNNIRILLSNNKDKLIDFININKKDLSNYNKVIVNLDLPDEARIENNIEKIQFIKTSDLAGV